MSNPKGMASTAIRRAADLDAIDFAKGGGLVPVVAQDADDGCVLMVAFANREALEKCLETGTMWYQSRSRGLWHKGDTSGNAQDIVELRIDCDADSVLALVRPRGPACHTGLTSCFGDHSWDALSHLQQIIHARANAPAGEKPSYTAKLLGDRNLRLKKLGEEASELAVACADGDVARASEEAADLLYHTAVAVQALGIPLTTVRRALAARQKPAPPSTAHQPPDR